MCCLMLKKILNSFNSLRDHSITASDAATIHFHYLKLISQYAREKRIDVLIDICIKDINLYPEFRKQQIKEDKERLKHLIKLHKDINEPTTEYEMRLNNYSFEPPNVPSFNCLINIYKNNNNLEKAIEVCKLAIYYELKGYKKILLELIDDFPQNDKDKLIHDYQLGSELALTEKTMNTIREFVQENPGVNKSKLFNELKLQNNWYHHETQEYIDKALKKGIIRQEKVGRTYQHYVN